MDFDKARLIFEIGLWSIERVEEAYQTRQKQVRFLMAVNLALIFASTILPGIGEVHRAVTIFTALLGIFLSLISLWPKEFKKAFVTDKEFYDYFNQARTLEDFITDSLGESIAYNLNILERGARVYKVAFVVTFVAIKALVAGIL